MKLLLTGNLPLCYVVSSLHDTQSGDLLLNPDTRMQA